MMKEGSEVIFFPKEILGASSSKEKRENQIRYPQALESNHSGIIHYRLRPLRLCPGQMGAIYRQDELLSKERSHGPPNSEAHG